jgi:holo-[acyl-carrier protein] synthase
MIIGIGIDTVPVARIEALIEQSGKRFVNRWFTPAESAPCLATVHPARHLAARLAAKEAVFKSLRFDGNRPVPWREIEILAEPSALPRAELSGRLKQEAAAVGLVTVLVSMVHADSYVAAAAIAVGEDRRAATSGSGRPVGKEHRRPNCSTSLAPSVSDL